MLSNDVLLDHVMALGASDAGIYVGQSNDVIVKNSEALFNVAGYEIENTDDADVFDNVAHCNTGGFLTFDLPGLNQYGDETRTFDNYSGYNNTRELRAGRRRRAACRRASACSSSATTSTRSSATRSSSTAPSGFVFASHELLDGNIDNPDKRMDLYPEAHPRPRQHLHDQRHARRSRPRRA